MHSRNRLHQMRSWVVAKVRADIANTQTSTTGLQILRMLKSRFVQCINLFKEKKKKSRQNTTTVFDVILVS